MAAATHCESNKEEEEEEEEEEDEEEEAEQLERRGRQLLSESPLADGARRTRLLGEESTGAGRV
jgi:hypothetical protein